METVTQPSPAPVEDVASPKDTHEKINLWNRFNLFLGKSMLAQVALVETAGFMNDSAWIHGHGSVTPFEEVSGSPIDAALWTLLPRRENEHPQVEMSKIRKVIHRIGEGAVLAAVGYGAQKAGVELMEHVNSGMNSGAGEYLVPAVSKISALTAVKNSGDVMKHTAAAARKASIPSPAPTLAKA